MASNINPLSISSSAEAPSVGSSGGGGGSGNSLGAGRQVLNENGPIIMSPGGSFTRFSAKYSGVNDIVPHMIGLSVSDNDNGSSSSSSSSISSSNSGGGGGASHVVGGPHVFADDLKAITSSQANGSGKKDDIGGNSSSSSSNSSSSSSSSSSSDNKGYTESNSNESSTIRALYGGAIIIQLDERFEDISSVREVPDHQEVFVDKFSETSFIVELLGYSDDIKLDSSAKYFFDDLSTCNAATSSAILSHAIFANGEVCRQVSNKFPRCAVIGKQSVAKFNLNETDDIIVCMLLLRLDTVGTDLMITMNIPVTSSSDLAQFEGALIPVDFFVNSSNSDSKSESKESSSSSFIDGSSIESSSSSDPKKFDEKIIPNMLQHFKIAINSLNIADWSLFA